MIYEEISLRYAQALFNLTTSKEEMESRKALLAEMASSLKKSPAWSQFFLNPQISRGDKKKVLEKSLLDPSLIHFLLLLLEKGKFKYLPEIANQYSRMVLEVNEEIAVTILTATPIDARLKNKLKKMIEKAYGKTPLMQVQLRPEILAGIIVFIGNKIIDFSITGRLKELKKMLLRRR
jgi:F-type H+-transporting ATPase subunit delta